MNAIVMVELPRAEPLAAERIDAITTNPAAQVVQRLVVGVTVFAGLPNSGKSALALDLSLSVCARSPWFGRKVHGGPVLYVAAEAAGSLVLRAKASLARKWDNRKLPLYVCSEVPALGDEVRNAIDTDRLIATINSISSTEGEAVAMCVLDTAAAVLAGSDENGSGMSLLASAAHRIHAQTGAAVVLLHHPGKTEGNALRGHSSLSGAADVIAIVETDQLTKVRSLIVTKARDFAIGEAIHVELEQVDLAELDAFGDRVSTVIVRPTDQQPTRSVKAIGRNQQRVLDALRVWAASTPAASSITSVDLMKLFSACELGRQRRPEVMKFLTEAGYLVAAVGGHTLNRELLT